MITVSARLTKAAEFRASRQFGPNYNYGVFTEMEGLEGSPFLLEFGCDATFGPAAVRALRRGAQCRVQAKGVRPRLDHGSAGVVVVGVVGIVVDGEVVL